MFSKDMSIKIDSSSVIATLSKYRSNQDIENFIGMKYSTVMSWESVNYSLPENEEKLFQKYIIEYMRRINLDAIEVVNTYYDLEKDNTFDFLAQHLFTKREARIFKESKVQWKQNFYKMCLNINSDLFVLQMEALDALITAEIKPKAIFKDFEERQRNCYSMPEKVMVADISGIKF